MDSRNDPSAIARNLRLVPDELGWAWAPRMQQQTGGLWLVLWEPGSQHFTAFYRGHTGDGGAYRKARTPRGLWLRMLVFDPQHPDWDVDDNADDTADASAWQPDIAATASVPARRAG